MHGIFIYSCMNVMKKDTPSSSKLFERWLSDSLAEWISMNTAFTNFLEIVIISVLNINPAIQWTERRKEREERYKHLINTRRDKNIPMTMLSDLVQLMQENHEEKKDIIWEMYESFICQWEHGQFFTPPHIADFMAKIIEVEEVESWNSVVDTACGSGKLLMWALRNNPRVNLIWVDIDRRCTMMACINCLFYGGCGTFLVW
jgi:type I restriction-modification system DNA methylase subunit